MSNLTAVVNNIISKVNTHTTDLSNKTTQIATHISGIVAYHLLQGNLAVSNYITTQGFNTTLYTGNGGTQSINTGIDMSTQWGNDASETFGGLVWGKSRSGTTSNAFTDTIRGVNNTIFSNLTNANDTAANRLTSFNANGFSLGSDTQYNASSATYASWNFQTTHRVTGTTNHGKAYTCHYNPFTGFTMVKYEGSGLAGHEIPHLLGRKLGLRIIKNITIVYDWYASSDNMSSDGGYLKVNTADAKVTYSGFANWNNETNVLLNESTASSNASGNYYIIYGWANSYFDESNKLIGNYEIGTYTGTSLSGNKVTTRGKPAWIMIKRLDSANDWQIHDNQRNSNYILQPNTGNSENTGAGNELAYLIDGFNVNGTGTGINASGGQYLYIVAYDTNSNGGGSYYPLASDIANLQVNNALIPIAQGIDSNGIKNTILSKNETVTGLTYTQGKNYVYYDVLGNKGVSVHKPRYLDSELIRTYAGESPDYYNVKENKWYSTNVGTAIYTNDGTGITGWTTSGATVTTSNGTLVVTQSGAAAGYITRSITTVIGTKYRIPFNFALGTCTSVLFKVGITANGSEITSITMISSTTTYLEFVAQSTTTYITMYNNSTTSGQTSYWDNISLFDSVIVPTAEITNGRNYLNHIVYADNDGGLLYVEELPKTQYVDEIKANDYKGKNACTAWVNFDGTTTPPTIRDSYNVSSVVRTSTGVFDIYFKTPMDNTSYTASLSSNSYTFMEFYTPSQTLSKATIQTFSNTPANINRASNQLTFFGGKN